MNFPSIVEFARFLWGEAISAAQITVLKCLYGLPLDSSERSLWRQYSGQRFFARYSPRQFFEAVLLLGRQSGKSSRIGTTAALFEALVVERQIPPGERLAILFFSPTLRQSTFEIVAEKLRSTPELAAMIEADSSSTGEIRLTNGIDLVSIAADPRTARGRAAILAIVDEAAFLRTDSAFVSNLPELLEAIRPSLIVQRGKLLLLSSPGGKEGPLYETWEKRAENPDVMVWRAPSAAMNPAIDPKLLERERKRGQAYYEREYEAQFVDAANPFLPTDALDAAVQKGVAQFEPSAEDVAVFAGIDLADRRDDCALAISAVRTVEGKRKVAVLFARAWKPGRSGHNVLDVLRQMGELCRQYGVGHARGDQKSMSVAEQVLGQYNVAFERVISAGAGSEQGFRTFLSLLNDGALTLPDDEALLTQLRRLEEKVGDGNRFLVEGRRGSKDDLAVACVLSVAMAADSLISCEPWAVALDLHDRDSWQRI